MSERAWRLLSLILGAVVVVSLLSVHQDRSDAVTGADWAAGHIIDDALFFDSSAMTESQVGPV